MYEGQGLPACASEEGKRAREEPRQQLHEVERMLYKAKRSKEAHVFNPILFAERVPFVQYK